MKELFDEDGHLTQDAFNVIIDNDFTDKMSCLEISEHMSFCDECLFKYTELLDDEILISPPKTMKKNVLRKIRFNEVKTMIKPYLSLTVAASFTMILWTNGFFNIPFSSKYNISNFTRSLTQSTIRITEKFSNDINELINSIEIKGDMRYEKK